MEYRFNGIVFRRLAGKEKVVDTTLAGKIATAGITADKLSVKQKFLRLLWTSIWILSSKIFQQEPKINFLSS